MWDTEDDCNARMNKNYSNFPRRYNPFNLIEQSFVNDITKLKSQISSVSLWDGIPEVYKDDNLHHIQEHHQKKKTQELKH